MRDPCGTETVQYLDCGSGYANLHVMNCLELNTHNTHTHTHTPVLVKLGESV